MDGNVETKPSKELTVFGALFLDKDFYKALDCEPDDFFFLAEQLEAEGLGWA